MYYIVKTAKTFQQATQDLAQAVTEHGFGVLHIHDLGNTLRNKGMAFAEECQVFEVCNPSQAAKVLNIDMRLNMALPCRVSVYTEQGQTYLGLVKPAEMLAALSDDADLAIIANEVEQKIIQMIDDTK